ncbi:MAG: alcohol dehydrogenase catalytic domain-containing protein, partial [Thermoplasmata archaeon]|nr:alcohol dehydrogenase catalytic domain-containing protein [Thermoplasmata archaeon]
MRAVVVTPSKPGARLAQVPDPPVAAGSVQVRVLEVGICGTDRDIASGAYGSAPAGRTDLILGHENVGVIETIGASGPSWDPGDLVVATVRRGCGHCRFCRTNQSDFCETGEFTERGIRGADGFLAERYVEVPEYLVRVPAALRKVAVLLEPLSVVEKAVHEARVVLDRRGTTPGESPNGPLRALVAGTGAIGMLASLLLRGLEWNVTAIDRHDGTSPAAAILAKIGARHANVAADWSEVGTERFDVIVEASGSAALDLELVGRLAPNGVLVLTGIPAASGAPIPVAAGALLRQVVLANLALVG